MSGDRIEDIISKTSEKKSIAVFLNPCELKFYLEDVKSHRQLLTIYNPYRFAVRYQISSNHSHNFQLEEGASDIIGPHCSVSKYIRHKNPLENNCDIKSYLAITLKDIETDEVIGKRCIFAALLSGVPEDAHRGPGNPENNINENQIGSESNDTSGFFQKLVILLIVTIIAALLFSSMLSPLKVEDMEDLILPSSFYINYCCNLALAFVFGAISVLLFREII